jgi:hypothetical protein
VKRRWASLLAATVAGFWPGAAAAYRPFDQTDADVAPQNEFELELGPIAVQHSPGSNALLPGMILNFGLVPRVEVVLEGDGLVVLGPLSQGTSRWQLDNSLLLKWVVREGVLQDSPGPSVALEAGILFPSLPHSEGAGASLAAIVSERWEAATVHLNLLLERTRDGWFDVVAGGIVEGPIRWTIRPVGEFFVDHSTAGTTAVSFLAGGIWRIDKAFSVDGAIRLQPQQGGAIVEARLGFTWSFAL